MQADLHTKRLRSGTATVARRAAAILAAALIVGVMSGSALAASRTTISFMAPSPDDGSTVTSGSVAFAFAYNRTPKQTRTLTCALSGPTATAGPCDAPVASGKGSRSGASYSGLANGAYTLTIALRLTDGGTITATRLFTVATTSAGHLYSSDFGTGAIGRAGLDGTGVALGFIGGVSSPRGVAVDAGFVYWTDSVLGTIGRARLDGTSVELGFITGASSPIAVAVDAGHIYWTEPLLGTIGRANLDGTDVDHAFITGAVFPRGVAVDAGFVYWANAGTIGRANLDGTDVEQDFTNTASIAYGLAVDAGHLYWANPNMDAIGRSSLDGTAVDQAFISGASLPYDVAVDAGS